MFKVLSSLFNAEKARESAFKGIDNLAFTNQEKANKFSELLTQYEPFKIAQRLVAVSVTFVYLFIHIVAGILYSLSVWIESAKEIAIGLAKMNNDNLLIPFGLIVSFYFAGGVMNGFKKK